MKKCVEKHLAYRGILFDLGWTLIYPSPTRNEVLIELLDQSGYQVSSNSFQKGLHAARRYYQEYRWSNRTRETLRSFWIDYYRILLVSLEESIHNEEMVSMIENKVQADVAYHLYDETISVLAELQRQGYMLGAVSNWNSDLPAICKRLGLRPFFEILVVSDIVGWHKPQPQIFKLALKEMNISAEATILVGDDYDADIKGARNVGITPVHLDRFNKGPFTNGDRIGNLAELVPFLGTKSKREI